MIYTKSIDSVDSDKDLIILFDGVCNLCNSFVDFIVKRDNNTFLFSPLESEYSRNILQKIDKDPDNIETFVLVSVSEEKIYTKSDAGLKVIKNLNFPYNLLYNLNILPSYLLDRVYDFIASTRYSIFGKRDKCRISIDDNNKERFI